jgi:hypothetical protein
MQQENGFGRAITYIGVVFGDFARTESRLREEPEGKITHCDVRVFNIVSPEFRRANVLHNNA